ncbi:MAG: restriction endonuclease [Nitrospirota bacterium]
MKTKPTIPPFEKFMNPILQCLRKMGGSGTINEIYENVSDLMNLTDDVVSAPHGKGGQSEVRYRIAWALTYLKKTGLITNSSRGVWNVTDPEETVLVNEQEIKKWVRNKIKETKERGKELTTIQKENENEKEIEEKISWQIKVLNIIQNISAEAFERLCQRLLRESGFIEATVTGRSGDGGIDGHGILRLAGLVSFRVLFQSKKYQGAVSAPQLRDFRGAMVGRADRGLFITTGYFTKDAQKEATRDGAPMIDLVDGEQLVEKLREFKLGIDTRMVEEIEIQKEWFDRI